VPLLDTAPATFCIHRLQTQFDEVQRMQQEQAALLQSRLDDLQARFDNRPSRPDDLQRISKLTELAKMKDAEVRRVREEMQYFKLELVNRENNFNKVFARSPNVGLMNPLQPSAGSTSRPGAPTLSTTQASASSSASAHLPAPPGAASGRPAPAPAAKPRRRPQAGGTVGPQLSLGGDSVGSWAGAQGSRSRAPSIGGQSFRGGGRK